jgi:two-component system, cell cycle response regulator
MDKKKILVIEDSPTQGRFAAMHLEEAGWQAFVTASGREGISAAEKTYPDLVLLDVILPDMDGFEVCNQLRQKVPSYLPILMFTSERVSVEDKVSGLAAGANDYLTKPFDPRELVARVEALLRVKEMVDSLVARLSTEHQSYQALKRIALTDHLTEVYNRYYFADALEREFGLAVRHAFPLTCIFADIDLFREFNNAHGHAIGDWVLKNTAALLAENLRQGDIIARYGGEEFVILLPLTSLEDGVILAERLRILVQEKAWQSPAGNLAVTVSFGVSAIPSVDIEIAAELVERADQAMYRSKVAGRNRVSA